jgi:hypothetical protein
MIFNSLCLLFLFINVYYIINYQRLDEPLRLRDFSKKLDLLYYFLKVVFIIWVLSGSFLGFSPIFNFMISVIFLRIPMFYLGKKIYSRYHRLVPVLHIILLIILLISTITG